MRAFFVCLGLVPWIGCTGVADPDMTRRLSEANDKVVACKNDVSALRNEIATLKQQLAQAAANPSRLELTDPEIINLIAEIKRKGGGAATLAEGDDVVIGRGDLSPRDASRVVKRGAQAMQVCYERALKKNSALQYQSGLGLVVELTVKPSGAVKAVSVKPSVDGEMSACIETAALRWKFPPFGGQPVVIAQKITLTPKT